jgi:hypothetical protein
MILSRVGISDIHLIISPSVTRFLSNSRSDPSIQNLRALSLRCYNIPNWQLLQSITHCFFNLMKWLDGSIKKCKGQLLQDGRFWFSLSVDITSFVCSDGKYCKIESTDINSLYATSKVHVSGSIHRRLKIPMKQNQYNPSSFCGLTDGQFIQT